MGDYFAHETAVIDEGANIGDGTKIWHFAHVSSGSTIGSKCVLGQNVYLAPTAKLGDHVHVQNNVPIYDGVVLEDYVFCGPCMVFTNVLNPRCEFPRRNEYQETIVKHGASIGANATVVCGHTLGEHCFVGAGSVVTKDIPAFALVVGNPAKVVGWMSRFGERLEFDVEGYARCDKTGDVYRKESDQCVTLVEVGQMVVTPA